MEIDPNWRILTIGDGDLSFSNALLTQYKPRLLEASVYDSESALLEKYAQNEFNHLKSHGIRVHTRIDITDPESLKELDQKFDVIIFQFPLITPLGSQEAFQQGGGSSNILNRRLLRYYLIHSFRYLLARDGQQLCFITSKDVKPYCEWNLEESLHQGLDLSYLGAMRFDSEKFPGYRIRNVARDSIVAKTRARTYVWGYELPPRLAKQMTPSSYLSPNHCAMCRAGPFSGEEDRKKHVKSKQHQKMQLIEDQWGAMISNWA